MIPEKKLEISWLKQNYLAGKVSPEEVIAHIIKRAQEHKEMNIWIEPPRKDRIQIYIDKLGEPDYDRKPLWGIPFAVKDNIDLEGYLTTAGCPAYSYQPKESAIVVKRLIAAGAIPLGKTNMDQFATGLVGTRSPYGEVHNALRQELISGGSSAGSAVCVAMGEASFSLGTDTAGSGRVPGALNRLVGYKPSVGAWPLKGVVPACASLDCVTVFAHCLKDAEAVDAIVRGFAEEDCWSREIIREANLLPQKIYIPQQELEFYGPFAGAYEKAWNKAVCQLEELGLPVYRTDIEFYQKAAFLLYGGPCVAERFADLGDFVKSHPADIFPVTKEILESGDRPDYTADYLYRTLHQLKEYQGKSNRILQEAVLVLPTCGGTYTRDEVRENPIICNNNMGKYTNHCNLLDLCAVNVPMEDAGDGLPFGISLFGTLHNEHLICGLAEELEKKVYESIGD